MPRRKGNSSLEILFESHGIIVFFVFRSVHKCHYPMMHTPLE